MENIKKCRFCCNYMKCSWDERFECIIISNYKYFNVEKGENKMATKDNINPNHYKNSCSLECIEAMEMAFGREAVFDFCKCNAWKYIWRWKNKNGEEDLNKAKWYLDYTERYAFGGKDAEQIKSMKYYVIHELGISEEPCDEQ